MNPYFTAHRMWLVKYTVNPYTITQHILNSQWIISTVPAPTVESKDWHYVNRMQPADVDLWEVVYYEPGVLGVYAAHDPYAELYCVVPCVSCDRLSTWRQFWGEDASDQAQAWLQSELNIQLESAPAWSNLISI